MKLSIITISYNNASGLKLTMESVVNQHYDDFEYIVVDGGSKDGSVEVIESIVSKSKIDIHWISEPDKGIYHAMNKGIQMAKGDYLQFLNSGDKLAADDVLKLFSSRLPANCPILYGNMLKNLPEGLYRDRGLAGKQIRFRDMFLGTLNHSPAWIKKELFNQYGLYDESLRIVSDWKWFLEVICLHRVNPVYTNLDITVFDMTGISNTQSDLEKNERKAVLLQMVPESVLNDMVDYSFHIEQVERLKRFPWLYKLFWFIERTIFRFEKSRNKKNFI